MTTWIEVLKIFVSWPFVILLLGAAFGYVFRSEIAQFLRNIGSIKLPGGAEIHTSQPPAPSSEKPEKEAPPEPDPAIITLNKEQQQLVREHIENLTKEAADAKQEKESLLETASNLLIEKDRVIKYWWFMFLSLFLVPTTKNVLRWFAVQTPLPTKEYYNEIWKTVVADPKQREIMLMVLLHHGLIEANGPLLQVTQNGRDFITFIGEVGSAA
ncbi:MAG: hypothetical protein ACE144_14020 [Thermodesulfobacteriota bacterium]